MKALVKSKAERGLWLEEVPEPAYGINDVLIRVRYAGICGTDVHIYDWDEWAQKTIHVPMVIGHEFVGEIVAVGSNVNDFFPGDIVSGEGHVVCGRCRNCLAGRRHLCAHDKRRGREPAGRVCRVDLAAHDEHLAAQSRDQPGSGGDLRSVRQCGAHGAVLSGSRRGCADYWSGSDWHHGDPRGAARGRAPRGDYGFESSRDWRWHRRWARRWLSIRQRRRLARCRSSLEMTEGFDVGLEMSGSPQALSEMIANMSHGGKIALLGIPGKASRWIGGR